MENNARDTNAEQPAYPITPYKELVTDIQRGYPLGLTKREYFAGLALNVYGAHVSYYTGNPKQLAKAAIELADELLSQLQSKP